MVLPFPRFGVEIECMIVDRATLAVRPIADAVLRDAEGQVANSVPRGALAWSNELVLHVLEFKTADPVISLEGLGEAFHASMREANRLLAPHGARLVGTAMHPWFDPDTETRLWPHDDREIYETFDRIFDCRGHGWSNLQSFHLNLPFTGDDGFRRLHSAIRLALPFVPVLAAASPIADGRPTGLLDTRLATYRRNCARVPSITGDVVPDVFRSEAEYREAVFAPIERDLVPLDPHGILEAEWTNARGAIARFDRGSIEIRLGDTQECPRRDLAVIGAIVHLVGGWLEETICPLGVQEAVGTGALGDLLGDAIRVGRRAMVSDPALLAALGAAGPATAGELLAERFSGADAAWSEDVAAILGGGNLAERILGATGPAPERERLRALWRRLADCLEANEPFGTGSGPAA